MTASAMITTGTPTAGPMIAPKFLDEEVEDGAGEEAATVAEAAITLDVMMVVTPAELVTVLVTRSNPLTVGRGDELAAALPPADEIGVEGLEGEEGELLVPCADVAGDGDESGLEGDGTDCSEERVDGPGEDVGELGEDGGELGEEFGPAGGIEPMNLIGLPSGKGKKVC